MDIMKSLCFSQRNFRCLFGMCLLLLCLEACAAPLPRQTGIHERADIDLPVEESTVAGGVHLPSPQLPAGMQATSPPPAMPAAQRQKAAGKITYRVRFESPEDKALIAPLQAASLLVRLEKSPPEDLMGLEIRIDKDIAEAGRVMQAFGYYNGSVEKNIDLQSRPVTVTLRLLPGSRYRIGMSPIQYAGGQTPLHAPATLADVGLEVGSPAVASDVLDAVERVPDVLKLHGYPLARVEQSQYVLNTSERVLNTYVAVDQGPLASMGDVRVEGTESVKPSYFHKLRPWRVGRLWNEDILQAYRETLSQQGLFRSIVMKPVPARPEEGDGSSSDAKNAHIQRYDVLISVADAPQHSVGGGVNYETDRGPGVQAFWEDRNLFSEGERLRADLSIWQDKQDARLSFRKPAFLDRDTTFIAEAWLRGEDTDAYRQRAAFAGAGVERRLSRRWWVSVRGTLEGGELEDATHAAEAYSMVGLPVVLRTDYTNNLLNPTQGVRATLTASPYIGHYGDDFMAGYTRLDMSAYLPVTDRLVLAARAAGGSILRDDAQTVPAAIRFYAGGGSSVRGYDYQSLGPRDKHGDPLGGASFLETSLEARFMVTQEIGIVPFLDGGNVYASSCPDPGKEGMQWGAGLGFRYHTAIGPLRVDVATPLNPRSGDSTPVFFYISIGQSF